MTDISIIDRVLNELAGPTQDGYFATKSRHIFVFRLSKSQVFTPLLYQQGLFCVLAGEKVARICNTEVNFGANAYLLLNTVYPVECESNCTCSRPLVGCHISLDKRLLHQVVEMTGSKSHRSDSAKKTDVGFALCQRNQRIELCIERLLYCLLQPEELALFEDNIIKEIYYCLLKSEASDVLYRFAGSDGKHSKISKAISFIQANYSDKISIDELAKVSNMSHSAFHRAFKQSITDTPVQYLKKVRLSNAKTLLVSDGMQANRVADKVGYESAAQFSRDFKRYFGLPPSRAKELAYRDFA